MKFFYLLLVIIFIFFIIFSSGCIETGQRTTKVGNSLIGGEVVEHTYLIGEDGINTKKYDVKAGLLGSNVYSQSEMPKNEYEELKSKFI